MSSPEHPREVNLSPRARQDFIDILRYTGERWGPQQLTAYQDKISDALASIGRNPELGHMRDDLPTTHRAYLVGSHIIIYRDRAAAIGIVRILHQRMSLTRRV